MKTLARWLLKNVGHVSNVPVPARWNRAPRMLDAKPLPAILVAGMLTAAILGIFVFAPTEATMGAAQRILYVHVSVAWCGLLGFLVTAGTGLAYLVRRNLSWDHWSASAAEVGWMCSGLTLVTGSLWARAAWGVWWTWDPRLVTSFILWAMYSGYLMVRSNVEEPHRRARLAAVLATVGMLDVPMVVMATRWFRGIHPKSPEMEPAMRVVLLASAAAFTAFFGLLLVRRRGQVRSECLLAQLQQRMEP